MHVLAQNSEMPYEEVRKEGKGPTSRSSGISDLHFLFPSPSLVMGTVIDLSPDSLPIPLKSQLAGGLP